MAIFTTSVTVTTTPQALISSATTWADIRGAHNYDPVPFSVFNDGVARIWLGGSGQTTASLGFPLLSSGTFTASLVRSEAVFAVTSAGAVSTAFLMAGRQTGGAVSSAA